MAAPRAWPRPERQRVRAAAARRSGAVADDFAAAVDAVSMCIRASLVPLASPENMRGRVLAVENVFIGASNELGAFESGVTAALFGLVGAIFFGGAGTLVIVALWWKFFPALRSVDRFEEVRSTATSDGNGNGETES